MPIGQQQSQQAPSSSSLSARRSLESINRSRTAAGLPSLPTSGEASQTPEPQTPPSTLQVIWEKVTDSVQSTVDAFIHQQDTASPSALEAKSAADAQPPVSGVIRQQAEQIHQQARQQHVAKIRQLAKEEIARQQEGVSQAAAQSSRTTPTQPLSAPLVRADQPYLSALGIVQGLPSSSAEAEVVCEFSSAVLKGMGHALANLADTILHPIDTIMGIVSPLSDLVRDAAIISANHTPVMSSPLGTAAHDFFVMYEAQQALAYHPHIYHEAVDRMQQRVEHIQAVGQYLVQAPWTQQVEIASSMVTSYFLPGAISNLVRAGVNIVGTGLPLNPASFSNWYPHHAPNPSVPTLSLPEGVRGGVLNVLAEGLQQLRQQGAFDAPQAVQPSQFYAALFGVLERMGEEAIQRGEFITNAQEVLSTWEEESIQRAQLYVADVREEYSGGMFWGDALDPKTHFLYRGTHEEPSKVFKKGFAARGNNTNLFEHIRPGPGQPANSAYVATSRSKDIALTFPKNKNKLPKPVFLYEINPQKNAINVEKELRSFLKQGLLNPANYQIYQWERERAVPEKIRLQDVKGYWEVKIYDVMRDGYLGNSLHTTREPFIPNPSYIPPPPGKLMYAAKALGHGVTGTAVVLDGMSLAHEFQQSTQSGNYDPFFRESARIGGGWFGAWVVGSIWAEKSARVCAAFPALGVYGAPTCGFIGGVAGSVVGYMKGGPVAGTMYDMKTAQHPSAQVVKLEMVQADQLTYTVETRADGARIGIKAQASQVVKSEVVEADGLTCTVKTQGDGAHVGKCEVKGDVKAQAQAVQKQQKAPPVIKQTPARIVALPVAGKVESMIAEGLREQQKKEQKEKAEKELAEQEARNRSLNPIVTRPTPVAQGNTTPTVYMPHLYPPASLLHHTPFTRGCLQLAATY